MERGNRQGKEMGDRSLPVFGGEQAGERMRRSV